jgi:hypothetical protein
MICWGEMGLTSTQKKLNFLQKTSIFYKKSHLNSMLLQMLIKSRLTFTLERTMRNITVNNIPIPPVIHRRILPRPLPKSAITSLLMLLQTSLPRKLGLTRRALISHILMPPLMECQRIGLPKTCITSLPIALERFLARMYAHVIL